MLRALLVAALMLPAAAWAEGGYTLTYRDSNEWVAQEDMKPLRLLLKDAKAKKANSFIFARNTADNEERSTNRALVLRDILSKNIKGPITLTEVPEDGVAAGTILVRLP